MSERLRERFVRAAGVLSRTLAVAIFAGLVWYAFAPIPTFAGASNYPAFPEYLWRSFAAFWSSFGFGDHDFLTSVSFWANFGWLDTQAPRWLVSLLAGGFCLGLGLAFWHAGREGDGIRLGRLAGLVVGWLSYFVCLAGGTFAEGLDVGGRYAVLLYLLLIVVAFQGWALSAVALRRGGFLLGEGVLLTCVVLHGGCLAVILARYF